MHQQGRGQERIRRLAAQLGWTVSVQEERETVCYRLERSSLLGRSSSGTRQRTSPEALGERILSLLRERPPLKASEISVQLGVPGSTVRRALKQLHEDGVLEKTVQAKSSPNQRYTTKAPKG